MTGFGDAQGHAEGIAFHVEVRCVNQKGFKLVTRLPDTLHALEADLEPLLRKTLGRGSCLFVLTMQSEETRSAYQVNEAALQGYMQAIAPLVKQAPHSQTDVAGMLALPGVLEPLGADEGFVDAVREPLTALASEACVKLIATRRREGVALAQDLETHLDVIATTQLEIASRVPEMVSHYQQRLKQRVDELLQGSSLSLDEGTLLREVAVFADRSDISEELARLAEHVRAFREELAGAEGDQVGRRLDFLAQEMLREANTIGSKASDAQIARNVVELKTRIDRIKEQVQNVA